MFIQKKEEKLLTWRKKNLKQNKKLLDNRVNSYATELLYTLFVTKKKRWAKFKLRNWSKKNSAIQPFCSCFFVEIFRSYKFYFLKYFILSRVYFLFVVSHFIYSFICLLYKKNLFFFLIPFHLLRSVSYYKLKEKNIEINKKKNV